MSPASIGAEMATCWRTIVPRLAAVIRVGAMLAFVRVLSPPKVGQSALFAMALPELRCWPLVMKPEAIIATVRKQIETIFFIALLLQHKTLSPPIPYLTVRNSSES